jgi:hypothetical protein
MQQTMSAENLYQNLKQMPMEERQKFFGLLSANAFQSEDMSHEQLFGQTFAVPDLKAFKKALNTAKRVQQATH